MGKEVSDKVDAVVIKQVGVLRAVSPANGHLYPWIQQNNNGADENVYIALKAYEMGYKPGDYAEYEIVIKPKR